MTRYTSVDEASVALCAIADTSERAAWVERKRNLVYPTEKVARRMVALLNANSGHVVAMIFGQEDDGSTCGEISAEGHALSSRQVQRYTDAITQSLAKQNPPILGRWDEIVIEGKT